MSIDKTTVDALQIKDLGLPPSPPVVRIEPLDYVDSQGNEALRVNVVLADDVTDESLSGDKVLAIKTAIRNRLKEVGVSLFPYIFLATQSEFLAQSQSDNED